MTQKLIIKSYLESRYPEWQYEYKIRAFRTPQGYWVGARGDRNVRQMIEDNEVEAKFEGKFRVVRFKPAYKIVGRIEKRAEQGQLNAV